MSRCCPLCSNTAALSGVDFFPAKDLRSEYLRQFNIDIQPELPKDTPGFDLLQCSACGMQFFAPLVSGSPGFYAGLSAHDFYYDSARWEFDRAVKSIPPGAKVVDVGCGDGTFISLLPAGSALGIEFNPKAISKARARGLDVRQAGIRDLDPRSADVVTFFQVLEHVTDPVEILRGAVAALRPEGRVIVTVPNNDAFMGTNFHEPLNAPPHHPLRWTRSALEFLPRLLPLDLEKLEAEPLSRSHLFQYRKDCVARRLSRMLDWRVPRMRTTFQAVLFRKVVHALVLASLKFNRMLPCQRTEGHSLFALYKLRSGSVEREPLTQ